MNQRRLCRLVFSILAPSQLSKPISVTLTAANAPRLLPRSDKVSRQHAAAASQEPIYLSSLESPPHLRLAAKATQDDDFHPMAMTATAGYTLSSAPRLGTHLEANWPETGLARAWNLYHAGSRRNTRKPTSCLARSRPLLCPLRQPKWLTIVQNTAMSVCRLRSSAGGHWLESH